MNPFLSGKHAIVTGGTRGIGRAVAASLVGEGASVAICGRSAEGVERAVADLRSQAASPGQVIGRAADVSKPEDVAAFFEFVDQAFDGLDILVNNAGIGVFAPMAELSIEDWRRTIDTNLCGAFYCSREAVRRIRNRTAGFVIQISSLAGRNPFAGGSAYNASKFGLNGFSEAMMLDHRYEGVRVCTIMPGSVDTEFSPRSPAKRSDWKIAAEDIAEVVLAVLRMPARTLISRIEVRPSQPMK